MQRAKYKRGRGEFGGTVVELGISAIIFFTLVTGALEIGLAGYRYVSLQFVTTELARWASLGNQLEYDSQLLTREKSLELYALQLGSMYSLRFGGESFAVNQDVENVSICAASSPNYPNCLQDDAGEAEELVRLTLREPTSILGLDITLSATALSKLEPFGN